MGLGNLVLRSGVRSAGRLVVESTLIVSAMGLHVASMVGARLEDVRGSLRAASERVMTSVRPVAHAERSALAE